MLSLVDIVPHRAWNDQFYCQHPTPNLSIFLFNESSSLSCFRFCFWYATYVQRLMCSAYFKERVRSREEINGILIFILSQRVNPVKIMYLYGNSVFNQRKLLITTATLPYVCGCMLLRLRDIAFGFW